MATEKNLKKLTIHKLKKKTYNALAEKPVDELVMLTDVGGQVAEITEASADYVGEIVQYVGGTNDTYTNGFFYKCIKTDGVYSWTQVKVQEGGGASLPNQTGNAGKFLMTDGTTASWGKALVNKSTRYPDSTMIIGGEEMSAMASGCVLLSGVGGKVASGATAIGVQAKALGANSVAIGRYATTNSNCIQLDCSGSNVSNNDPNTFKVGNNNGNFEILSADGTIPRERMTQLVEVLPTTENGYTTIKNFGNNYIEASGIYEFGALGANEEVVDVILFPEGVQFAEGQMYWAIAHVTTEDSNANAVVAHITSRTATDLTIVYKNLGTTEVENLFICWEVRGVVASK